jgi:hypothetical protein
MSTEQPTNALAPTVTSIGAQPVDSDLTAIALLSTTAFGRALLTLADEAAGRAALSVSSTAEMTAAIAAAKAGTWDYQGSVDCSANPNYPAAVIGDLYRVSVAGKIGGASGTTVRIKDWFVAIADNAGGTQAAVGASWEVWPSEGELLSANNLSDVANPATARSNLSAQAEHANLTAVAAVTTGVPNAGKVIGIDAAGSIALITVTAGLATIIAFGGIGESIQLTASASDTATNSPVGVMSPSWS